MYFPVSYQTKESYIFSFCSTFLAKAKGPELYKCPIGNIIPAQVQISARGDLCCARGMSGRVTPDKPVEITGSPGKYLSLSHGPRVVQSNPLASGDSGAA